VPEARLRLAVDANYAMAARQFVVKLTAPLEIWTFESGCSYEAFKFSSESA